MRFTIDPDLSRASIDATSTIHPIHAETDGLTGYFEAAFLEGGRLDPGTPPRAHLEVPVNMLSSGNVLYDRELRRRVDARRYRTITADLTAMKESERADVYVVAGDVGFRGATKTYEGNMTLVFIRPGEVLLSGEGTFDIRDFGLAPPRILALRVHPEVVVNVAITAREEGR